MELERLDYLYALFSDERGEGIEAIGPLIKGVAANMSLTLSMDQLGLYVPSLAPSTTTTTMA